MHEKSTGPGAGPDASGRSVSGHQPDHLVGLVEHDVDRAVGPAHFTSAREGFYDIKGKNDPSTDQLFFPGQECDTPDCLADQRRDAYYVVDASTGEPGIRVSVPGNAGLPFPFPAP